MIRSSTTTRSSTSPDALIVSAGRRDHRVRTVRGDARHRSRRAWRSSTTPTRLICAGFIDTHIHYVQTGIIGAFGSQLIDWLNHYTFIEEQRFADKAHADESRSVFFDQLLPTARRPR